MCPIVAGDPGGGGVRSGTDHPPREVHEAQHQLAGAIGPPGRRAAAGVPEGGALPRLVAVTEAGEGLQAEDLVGPVITERLDMRVFTPESRLKALEEFLSSYLRNLERRQGAGR